jgi:hypothetical protein
MNNNPNIQSMLETAERIFVATHQVLSAVADGGRIQIKELAKTVGLMIGMEPKLVLNFVNHYVHHTDIAYVTRGKNGGVIKGQKPIKIDTVNTNTDS